MIPARHAGRFLFASGDTNSICSSAEKKSQAALNDARDTRCCSMGPSFLPTDSINQRRSVTVILLHSLRVPSPQVTRRRSSPAASARAQAAQPDGHAVDVVAGCRSAPRPAAAPEADCHAQAAAVAARRQDVVRVPARAQQRRQRGDQALDDRRQAVGELESGATWSRPHEGRERLAPGVHQHRLQQARQVLLGLIGVPARRNARRPTARGDRSRALGSALPRLRLPSSSSSCACAAANRSA